MTGTSAAIAGTRESTRRTKVLHVTHDMGVGGAEEVVRQLVSQLDPARFESRVVCIDGRVGPVGRALREDGFAVDELSRQAGFDRKLVGRLRRLIREGGIDVVHCHQYTPYCYGVVAAAFINARVVFTEHGRFHPDRHSWKRRLANQVLARLTDEIVAISAATRNALVEHEWFRRQSIRLVYNGVAPPRRIPAAIPVRERLGIGPDTLVFGTIARLDPIKNQRMMLEALALVRARFPDCVLLMAGDGPEHASLRRHAETLGLESNVRFAGFVTDVGDHLDAIDVFLLTSWSEGTSMTLLEAMSYGKAIVVTRVGGNTEILDDGETALFVEAGDEAALARFLERLVWNGALREQLGRAARESFARRFQVERMVAAYEALYEPARSQ